MDLFGKTKRLTRKYVELVQAGPDSRLRDRNTENLNHGEGQISQLPVTFRNK